MSNKKILISGFEAFGKFTENSTTYLIESLQEKYEKIILPVSYQRSFEVLEKKIENINPHFILMLGMSSKRNLFSLESLAININHAEIADNDDKKYIDEKIFTDSPLALKTDFPIVELMNNCNSKVEISHHAGTYVCNNIYYKALYKKYNCLFVHVPSISQYWSKENLVYEFSRIFKEIEQLVLL